MIPCSDMHQSFADAHVKWFFDILLMFADSFSVLSIRYVAQGLHGCSSITSSTNATHPSWNRAYFNP